jgi:hypothetical protein
MEWAATKCPGFSQFAFRLTAATKCNHWIKLSRGPQKHSIAKKLKNGSIQTQGKSSPSNKLVNYLENTSKMQQAQQLLKSYRQQTLVT